MLRLMFNLLTLINGLLWVAKPVSDTSDDEQVETTPIIQPRSLPEPSPKSRPTFTSYYQYDTRGFDTGNVNLALRQKQLPILPEKRNGGGGGLLMTRGRWTFDGGGQGAGGLNRDGVYATGFGFGYGYFNVGMLLARTGWLRVFPFAGIGGGGIGVNAAKDDDADESTDNDESSEGLSVGAGDVLFNIGIGLDFTPSIGIRGLRLVFGVRMGYSYAPLQKPPDDTTPAFQMSGPFVRGVVGFMVGG